LLKSFRIFARNFVKKIFFKAQSLGLSLRPPPPSDKLFRLVTVARQYVEDPESKEKEAVGDQVFFYFLIIFFKFFS